jgi:plasmid stabilization system protein ParE
VKAAGGSPSERRRRGERSVLKRPRATIDLLDHFAYIGERGSLEKAEQFLKAVERAVELLAGMPEMNPYLILYRPLKRGTEVLHVFHGAQDVTALLEEEDES